MEVHDKRVPPRVFAHPMEGRYTRENRKSAEAALRPGEPRQASLSRSSGCRKWIFGWDSERLDAVPDPEGAEGDTQGAEGDAQGALLGERFQRVSIDDPGFSEEELREAIATSAKSEVLEDLHDAATVLREVTASGGEEGGRSLLRQGGVRALVRLLTLGDLSLEEDAVLCFLNLLQHERLRALLADQGLMVHLVQALKATSLASTRANLAAGLSLLVRNETHTWSLVTSGALETLVDMLRVARSEVREPMEPMEPTHDPTNEEAAPLPPLPLPPGRSRHRRSTSAVRTEAGMLFSISESVSQAGDSSVHDACLSLMHLARFHTIRKALLKHDIVHILADVAKVASIVDSEQSVAALFHLLAKAEGGPGAICLKDDGAGALALLSLVETGMESTQELALDALSTACRDGACAAELRRRGFVERLETSPALKDASRNVKAKLAFTLSLLTS